MKYIKKYESRPEAIEDGEYVIVEPDHSKEHLIRKDWLEVIQNNYGKIVSHYYVNDHLIYIIDYNCDIDDGHRRFKHEEIIAHSKDKTQLELIRTANKYNI